ncbi:MAG: Inner membrane protein YgaZ [Paracidovorax wautersii]|uniref:Inner membrane protein YgaZ n=1 Tax=Paracidovorax wautersii TaxID=1177982 RepID=A0A7V8FMF7_9BURK|nr:MAG: Inner membrane protein YgaZ [Paracidovorax wautersii]
MFWRPELRRHPEFMAGVRDMLPVAPGLGAWAVMSGVAMVKYGLSPLEAGLMTLMVYAGSSQLASLPLIAAGAPLWVIVATAFCVNLRFVVFSAHLRLYLLYLPKLPRLITAYLSTDMSYVMLIKRHPVPTENADDRLGRQAYLAGNACVSWFSWMSLSLAGILLANVLPMSWGLGFAGILALVGILCSLLQTPLQRVSALVAGAAAVLTLGLPLKRNILVAIATAVVVGLMLEKRLPGFGPTESGGTKP